MSSIDFTFDRRRILIPVTLLPPDTGFDATGVERRGLLDTGATTSAIKMSIAERLGLRTIGKRPLFSAQGEGHADRYIFRIAITPAAVSDRPVFPYFFPETDGFALVNASSFDALIGMDILARCDLLLRRNGTGRLTFG
jgi:hypothetical protein